MDKEKVTENGQKDEMQGQEAALLTVSSEELEAMVKALVDRQIGEKAEEAVSDERKAIEAREEAWLNEKVPVQLFRDGKDYKDDKFVAVGGTRAQIKRGATVMIPRKLAMVLEEANAQINKANDRNAQISAQFFEAMSR